MNTPSHLILNLCALGHGRPADPGVPIAIGAVLPDAPMFVFYAVEKLVLGVSEATIWTTDYFAPGWQDFFDLFNSLPLLAVGLTVTLITQNRWWALLFGSMVMHCLLDLPFHHDDAHRHLFPFSDWRFASPVSYWDPDHYGQIAAPLEAGLGLAGCAILWRRHPGRASRVGLALLATTYVGFILFAMLRWA